VWQENDQHESDKRFAISILRRKVTGTDSLGNRGSEFTRNSVSQEVMIKEKNLSKKYPKAMKPMFIASPSIILKNFFISPSE
jgi:hypothetical protein